MRILPRKEGWKTGPTLGIYFRNRKSHIDYRYIFPYLYFTPWGSRILASLPGFSDSRGMNIHFGWWTFDFFIMVGYLKMLSDHVPVYQEIYGVKK